VRGGDLRELAIEGRLLYRFGIVLAFETTDDEVAPGEVLKIFDEHDVDRGSAGSTKHRDRLRHHLL
jgi:hypothetical protein